MKGRFIEVIRALKSLDYDVKCKQMNSKYYNVPQSRERLIFIGVRKDLGVSPVFPEASSEITSVKDAIGREGYIEYRRSYSRGKFSLGKSSFRKPCLTITKTGMGWTVHPRPFSIEEVKILCSFPKDWKMSGSEKEQWARLGNAVMPRFMEAIASTIKTEILAKIAVK